MEIRKGAGAIISRYDKGAGRCVLAAALRAGHDVRFALIGAGVYASHGYERSHRDGVENTFKLLKAYLG